MLSKIVNTGLFLFAASMLTFSCARSPSDSQIRSSVVKLSSKMGSCSGTQIEAPSGHKYILTAAHCLPLAEDGMIHVSTEDAGSYFSKVIEEDKSSDLLLLEPAPGIPAIKIAKDIGRFEELRSFTHGHGYPTYKTKGTYIGEDIAQFVIGEIMSDADKAKCSMPKNKIESMDFFGIAQIEICTVKVVESITNVPATPGSSGGLVANSSGELAGVVSAGNETFTYLVTLKDINRFLSSR